MLLQDTKPSKLNCYMSLEGLGFRASLWKLRALRRPFINIVRAAAYQKVRVSKVIETCPRLWAYFGFITHPVTRHLFTPLVFWLSLLSFSF